MEGEVASSGWQQQQRRPGYDLMLQRRKPPSCCHVRGLSSVGGFRPCGYSLPQGSNHKL